MERIRIATRRSALALWQAEEVARILGARYPELRIEYVPLTTRGDQILDQPLAAIGGKGLFLKELQQALLDGSADIAVHSFKDVPVEPAEGLLLPVALTRGDARDALVSVHHSDLSSLPAGSVVGTSSLRRHVQLRAMRPDLRIEDLRGNVNTRLAKLDSGQFDAIILACAGLQRLGLEQRIRQSFAPTQWVPAAGQGAIAIECRERDADVRALLAPLNDPSTQACVGAERAMTRRLQGSCSVPIGAYAQLEGETLVLHGLVGDAQTGHMVRASARGSAAHPALLGEQVAAALMAQGALPLLQAQTGHRNTR